MKNLTIVAATPFEAEPVRKYLQEEFQTASSVFFLHDFRIEILITGIGILETSYSLMKFIRHQRPDAWIQMGIGGAVDTRLSMGTVYKIKTEMLHGFGAQDQNGKMMDQFELGWRQFDEFPYENAILNCPFINVEKDLPAASGMTTLFAHGHAESIATLNASTHGQIENMEGAPFFYISLMENIPFLSLRAISNVVEARDKSKWEIEKAIDALNNVVISMMKGDAIRKLLGAD